jgi:TolB-like protein/cytochrome c-type biogenesis protein CcmH/NrfG
LDHFLKELKRRNVVRVGLAYLAVAWLVIQLVGEIGPMLDFPEWIPRAVLGVLAAGFVIATVLAWVYELTNKGLRRTTEVDRDESLVSQHGRQLDFIIIGALLLALTYFIWESRFSEIAEKGNGLESVAILPFRDLSASGDQDYFAEGISEELLNALSRLPGLKVAGRASSFSFRGSELDMPQIARSLNVTHLLEGSVRTSGQQLRVTAQLINGTDGFQLWSRVFDGRIEDVFHVQDQIAGLVVEAMQQQLEGEGVGALPKAVTTNMDSYNAYLLGRYELAHRTKESIRTAESLFRRAMELDEQYAPARSGLAKTLVISPYYGALAPPVQLFTEASELARSAIKLDANNSEAWSVLGTISTIFERNWEQAKEQFQRSVQIHPNDASNLNLYGDYLYNVGDFVGAIEMEGRAAELEPLSAANQHELAVVLFMRGEVEQAIALEKLAVELSPEFQNAWSTLARIYLASGRDDDLDVLLQAQGNRFSSFFKPYLMAWNALRSSNERELDSALNQLRNSVESENVSATALAYLYAELGDDEQAARWVEFAQSERDPILLSPMYFFLPEDWPHLPATRAALSNSGLDSVYDLRRQYIAADRGRKQSFSMNFQRYNLQKE